MNVYHQCKAWFCFLSSSLAVKEANTPISLYPSLLIFTSNISVELTRATQKALDRVGEPTVTIRAPAPLPLCTWCCSAVVTLTSHFLCVCVTSRPAAWLCSCPAPHHRADALRKTTEMLWRSSKLHESWLLFVLLHCSSCCVYPWSRLRATTPISQTSYFQSVFQGTDRLSSVFFVDGRSLGWLWWCKWTSSSLGNDKWF